MTATPLSIRETTASLNVALEAVNGIHNLIPLRMLTEVVSNFDLDASFIVHQLKGDKGRMLVPLSDDIFLVMLWERFETGRFEIIAYATSNYDDHREPYTTELGKKKRVERRRHLAKAIGTLPIYFNGKGHAFSAIEQHIKTAGFDYYEFQDMTTDSMFVSGSVGRLSAPVGHNTYVHVSWYRMDSGNSYEITAYMS